jgi:murein DD-endopeptidase MepM/ murein hydrolase activator NlpD
MKKRILLTTFTVLLLSFNGYSQFGDIGKAFKKLKKNVDKELTKTKKSVDKTLTKAKKDVDNEATKSKENIDKNLTKSKEDVDRELTTIKEDIDRELTNAKFDMDQTLTIAKEDVVTEWNYFWATVCGESSERKAIQRKFDQKKLNAKEKDSLMKLAGSARPCGGGVSVNSDGEATLLDKSGSPSEKPVPESTLFDDWPAILDWTRKIEMEDWEKNIGDKFVAGWLISPELRGGMTWFSEAPGPVTKTNKLRKAKNGHPMTGARRASEIKDKNGKPVLDANGNKTYRYRLHKGTDYAAKEGDIILAAINGDVSYHKSVYKGFDMIRITNRVTGHRQETLYIRSSGATKNAIENGVKRGDVIGVAVNIQNHSDYKNVPNHVHVNFISPEGVYIAPNNEFGVAEDSEWVAVYCEDTTCLSPKNGK